MLFPISRSLEECAILHVTRSLDSLVRPKTQLSIQLPIPETSISVRVLFLLAPGINISSGLSQRKKKILFGTTGVMDSRYISPRILSRQVPAVSNAVFNYLNCTAVTAKPTISPSKGSLLHHSTPSPFFQGMEVEVRIFGFDAHIYQKSLW